MADAWFFFVVSYQFDLLLLCKMYDIVMSGSSKNYQTIFFYVHIFHVSMFQILYNILKNLQIKINNRTRINIFIKTIVEKRKTLPGAKNRCLYIHPPFYKNMRVMTFIFWYYVYKICICFISVKCWVLCCVCENMCIVLNSYCCNVKLIILSNTQTLFEVIARVI